MTRNLVCLAAAIGLLTFAGCGDVPNSGAAVATNTAALKPLPPAPEDKDMPVTPMPLAPSPLPATGAPTGQPARAEPANTNPAADVPAIGQPAVAPPNRIAGSAAPRSNTGGGLFQNLFGNATAAKTTTPAGPSDAPVDTSTEIALSGATVARTNAAEGHFQVAYSFTRGAPVPSHWYTLVFRQDADGGHEAPESATKIQGGNLKQQGTLNGVVSMPGRSPKFEISVWEGPSREDKGHKISVSITASVHREFTKVEKNSVPMGPAGVGVGAQGKGYGADIITAPVATLFSVKETIAFKIQIPQAMKFFEGQNNRKPSSNDEFMEKIIKDNNISLPELPAGEKYIYDPQKGELMYTLPKK